MYLIVLVWLPLIGSPTSAQTASSDTPPTPPLPPWVTPQYTTLPPIPPPPPTGSSSRAPVPSTSPKQSLSGDFIVQYYDKNISTKDLLIQLNMTRGRFDVSNICPSLRFSCESADCSSDGFEAKERMTEKPCYCDKLCLELGDCCYDYFVRCAADISAKRHLSRHTCVKTKKSDVHGYAMIDSCPSSNFERRVEYLCKTTSSSLSLPVLDLADNIAYKNSFCARCNHASKPEYFKFFASCVGNYTSRDIPKNRSLMLEFIMTNCEWNFEEPRGNCSNLKTCLAVEAQCQKLELRASLLPSLCSFYAFPVCNEIKTKNPHCEMCHGSDISTYNCDCVVVRPPPPTEEPPGSIPSLDILFDFSSSSQTVKIGDETTVVENKACNYGFAFDPFTEKCIKVLVTPSWENESVITYNCKGSGFVKMDLSSATVHPNGSISIPLHKRTYDNGSYFINGSAVYVCMNLTQNFTEKTTLASTDTKITGKQIITYVGCAISMTSLIILLGIYITVAELRTLPGKNLMTLSCAMLLYHTVFLLTDQTSRPYLCMAVSVLLHYFLLSSFCWMSVMAFDVAKTFGKKGPTSRSSQSGGSKAALVKYHIFAWTSPALIVLTSVILDTTGVVFLGYGHRICWISNGKALLVALGVPVALILLFNSVALSFTLFSIWKAQKSTRRVADQSQRTSLPVLYIKLSSVLGLTWVLGFIVPFAKVEFLSYLFVICNSLQGFFIFLAFVANKRTLNEVKGTWKSRSKSSGSKNAISTTCHSRLTHARGMDDKLVTTAF